MVFLTSPLQCGKGFGMTAPQNAEDVILLVGDVFVSEKVLDFFYDPAVGKKEVDHSFLPGARKASLLNIILYSHKSKNNEKGATKEDSPLQHSVLLFPRDLLFLPI
jgi:hypothetical protein